MTTSRKPESFVELREQPPPKPASPTGSSAVGDRQAGARKSVAMIVCHGMGQQVPFETIDNVARILRRADIERGAPAADIEVITRFVDLGIGKPVGRAEIALKHDDADIDVHIYEAYWAPLTAGRISLRQVIAFLLEGAFCGLRTCNQTFLRWMFGGWQEFPVTHRAFWKLLVALAFVLSLVAMNAAIVAVVASRGLGHDPGGWPQPALLDAMTADFVLVVIAWLCAGLALAVAYAEHQRIGENDIGWDRASLPVRLGTGLTGVLVWAAIAVTIFAGALLCIELVRAAAGWTTLLAWACTRATSPACRLVPFSNALLVIVWALVVIASWLIRKLLVEYVGDVVAYVNAHEASEFHDIRDAIQKTAHDIGAAVYALQRDDRAGPQYSRVVVAGHSLGSVVAYDMLNRLLLEDSWRAHPNVLARTGSLVTFGSPLDKTAFIFRSQKPIEAEVREALAAGIQPLVADRKYRETLSWTNLWAKPDWISGNLIYYDTHPPVAAWCV